jgi:hypothetical protein
MFMLSEIRETAEQIKAAMHRVYSATNIPFNIYVSGIESAGVRVMPLS